MNKRIKKIIFGCLSFIIISAAMTGCKPKNVEEKEPDEIKQEQKQELVYIREDGTKVNQSEKIVNKTQKIGNLEFKNVSIMESGNLTRVEFDVYNSSNEILNEKEITIILLNDKNEEVKRMENVYIGTIAPNGTTKGQRETTLDYAEVYDIKFIE